MAKAKKTKVEKKTKEVKPKAASLFDYINWLTYDKRKWEDLTPEEKKGFNVFIVNRVLSMELSFCEAINDMQEYILTMEKELVWRIYSSLLPEQKLYNKYIKPTPIKDINEKDIKYILKYFNCTYSQAIDYLKILSKEELQNIKNNFQYEK